MKSELFNTDLWARKKTYEFYRSFKDPFFSVCCNIDVSRLYHEMKKQDYSFQTGFIYHALKVANSILNFRLRFKDENVYLMEEIEAGSTILFEDESFGFVYYEFATSMEKFQLKSRSLIESIRISKSFEPKNDRMDLLYFTTLPWISFTSFKHAHDPRINASIPRITIGKFTKNASKVLLPVHVEVNHALCDGLHVGRFFHALEKRTQ